MKKCANGLPGADIEKGEQYNLKRPCANSASQGSIYCPSCRVAAGGYLRYPALALTPPVKA